eukprot:jgi/Picsp_1/3246/NSC_06086-R1_snare associated golgi protein
MVYRYIQGHSLGTRQGGTLRIVGFGLAHIELGTRYTERDSQRGAARFGRHPHQEVKSYSKILMDAIDEESKADCPFDARDKTLQSPPSGVWHDSREFRRSPLVALVCIVLSWAPSAEALQIESLFPTVEQTIENAGPFGPIIFVSLYALSAVFLVPASFLTIAAGFLFGPITGSVLVSVAATGGAALAFITGRYIARPLVEGKIQGDERFSAIDRAIAKEGSAVVFLLRLSPVFPYGLLNYALSLTSIRFFDYLIASWVGMLPGTIAYVALGSAGKAAADGSSTSFWQILLYIVGALSTLGVTILISRVASKALRDMDE